MKTSTASFGFLFIAGLAFSTSNVSFGSQIPASTTQNVIEPVKFDTGTMSLRAFFDNDLSQFDESKILMTFISDIMNNSKPMPAEFTQLINDNFWDLVD